MKQQIADLEQRVAKLEQQLNEKIAAVGATAKCVNCSEMTGILELDDGSFICESCAQIMSELGNELN